MSLPSTTCFGILSVDINELQRGVRLPRLKVVCFMTYKPKHQADSSRVLPSVLKVLYLILVALCAVIVVLFIVYKAAVKPPEVETTDKVEIIVQKDPAVNPDGTFSDTPEPTVTTIELTRKKDFHTFLLLGTDDGNGNADTIMVGSFDLKNKKISVVSVPRDTLVDVSRKMKKINAAYGVGGVDQMLDELKPILGFRPDHYIAVDIQAFVEVVDELGGVNFYVPEDMFHNDGAGFIIDLKEGQQLLNGYQALQLVRYRGYQNADLGRIQTQQKFIRQLAKQVLSWSTVSSINEFAKIFSTYFDTDLTVSELAYFGIAALGMDFSSDITFATLPGDGMTTYLGIPYYYLRNIIHLYANTNIVLPDFPTHIFFPFENHLH